MRTFVFAVAAFAILGCKEAPKEKPVATSPGIQIVNVKISGADYVPASVKVAKGQPIRLNFTRDEKTTCGDTVVFPALNIRKEVPVGKVVAIDITPQKSGDIAFTCGMNMMQGTVVVQ